MTIDDGIALLQNLKRAHDGAVPLFFDCPSCRQSFTPTTCVAVAVHVSGDQNPPKPTFPPNRVIQEGREPR